MPRPTLPALILALLPPLAAHATLVSTAPATLPAPITLQGPSATISLDLDGDGTPDVTFASTQGVSIALQPGPAQVSYSGFYITPDPSTAAFGTAPTAFTMGPAPVVNLVAGQLSSDWPYDPGYLEILFPHDGEQTLGYIEATLLLDPSTQNATLTIQDYGYDVPEPRTLALLAVPVAALLASAVSRFGCQRWVESGLSG